MPHTVELVDVTPRDGFQPIGPFVPTDQKVEFIRRLHAAGLKRIEITSFTRASAVPQMRDAAAVVAAAKGVSGLVGQVLVPTARRAEMARVAGAGMLAYVLSTSETHNQSNVRRSVAESIEDYGVMVAALPVGTALRLNLATAFDCPFEGRVSTGRLLEVLDRLAAVTPSVELCLCDTTGRATPDQVWTTFATSMQRYPGVASWAFHGHDTYGMGVANCHAAFRAGVPVFDGATGGLGGCPFAPGATGNVATEDLAWMFEAEGVVTGVDLGALLRIADDLARVPGSSPGGRVRQAAAAAARSCAAGVS